MATPVGAPLDTKRYESLRAWQACHQVVLAVYRLTSTWPTDERFGLVSQLRRAAVSAPANLAEGSAKRGPREFRRSIDVALGSLAEVSYYLKLALDLGYVGRAEWGEVEALRDHAGRLTWGLNRAVQGASARKEAKP
ncbi:MAG TPA: four helix bundle protein [Gemmatimonadales bacterium]|nr:four helix bundle protein [Gemmatimonadales bacterium]